MAYQRKRIRHLTIRQAPRFDGDDNVTAVFVGQVSEMCPGTPHVFRLFDCTAKLECHLMTEMPVPEDDDDEFENFLSPPPPFQDDQYVQLFGSILNGCLEVVKFAVVEDYNLITAHALKAIREYQLIHHQPSNRGPTPPPDL